MAEAVGTTTAIAIASSQAVSVASAVANAVATAVAGVSIGLGYASGQAIREVTGGIRDIGKSALRTTLGIMREYLRLISEKPEVGVTGTLLVIYMLG